MSSECLSELRIFVDLEFNYGEVEKKRKKERERFFICKIYKIII